MFSAASWHKGDQLDEDETWEPKEPGRPKPGEPTWDPDLDYGDPGWDPLNTTVPAWTLMGAAVYKSLLDSYGPKPLPAINPAYVRRYLPLYNAAVGLAEIGVTQQLPQLAATPPVTSKERPPVKSYKQYWEYGETFAWAIGTAAAIAVAGLVGGGPKGRPSGKGGRSPMGTPGVGYSFNMRTNPAFAFMYSSNPLRSLTTDVYGQLAGGYVPVGTQIIKEREALGHGRTAANQGQWADPGLG